jgi:hemerythrin-like domain-containing protein
MEPAGWLDRMRADHQRVLERLESLAPAAGAGSRLADLAPVRELVAFLARQFDSHMAAEDQVLFPILAEALPATTDSLRPLRQEHQELRTMLEALTTLLDAPAGRARDEQLGVQLADLADLLRIHVRKEERLVFQVAEHVLRPGELDRLVSQRTAATPARRPSAPSPPERNP